jgi:cyclopropane fatty-acyl-phospholipid synthase-like methyltransferase
MEANHEAKMVCVDAGLRCNVLMIDCLSITQRFIEDLRSRKNIAEFTEKANEQHYEVRGDLNMKIMSMNKNF